MYGNLKINEVFFSIQGESTHAGRPCVFVRLSGCNLRCSWCDTEYAFSEGTTREFKSLLKEIRSYECRLVEITGGEPLLQKEVLPFMNLLADEGFEVLLETGGHMNISQVDSRVQRIMDIKCPSSNESKNNSWSNIDLLNKNDQIKFVIADRKDYNWAKNVLGQYNFSNICAVLFSPVFGRIDNQQLAEWILADRLDVRYQLQIHKYIWTPETKGV